VLYTKAFHTYMYSFIQLSCRSTIGQFSQVVPEFPSFNCFALKSAYHLWMPTATHLKNHQVITSHSKTFFCPLRNALRAKQNRLYQSSLINPYAKVFITLTSCPFILAHTNSIPTSETPLFTHNTDDIHNSLTLHQ
jgi:hypothetical protein